MASRLPSDAANVALLLAADHISPAACCPPPTRISNLVGLDQKDVVCYKISGKMLLPMFSVSTSSNLESCQENFLDNFIHERCCDKDHKKEDACRIHGSLCHGTEHS
jgi:hypothetical protein